MENRYFILDQVILLESGHCKVVGRLKEAIIRGGTNVFPKEIEEFFLSHPDVVDAQVRLLESLTLVGVKKCVFTSVRKKAAVSQRNI
ncbi:unnamed protein product [Timema podura]|uniref:Uncharacterized protein n=1 Tax=Timema podura TaxID=61482 RepID=A0ABN7PHS6_TIMPD|nr:unnamed protein product [Timema podura]